MIRNLSGIPYISLVSQHFVIFFQHLGNLKINDAQKMPSNSVILHFTFSTGDPFHTGQCYIHVHIYCYLLTGMRGGGATLMQVSKHLFWLG